MRLVCSTVALIMLGLGMEGDLHALELPGQVEIEKINFAGSGCPESSVSGSVSPDRQAFSLLFSEFMVSTGPAVPPPESHKRCNILVKLSVPSGWSYTVFTVDYRGYASLDEDVEGLLKSLYLFGRGPPTQLRAKLVGPHDDNFALRDELALRSVRWSPCGGSGGIHIDTDLRVNNQRNREGSGLMTVDNLTGELTQVYGLQWRRCP